MATPSAPSCEIRRVIVHFYPDSLKVPSSCDDEGLEVEGQSTELVPSALLLQRARHPLDRSQAERALR